MTPRRLGALVAVGAALFAVSAGQALAGGDVVLENESFVCTGPVDLDLVKVTMREYSGGGGGPGVDAIVFDPGCTGRIGRIEVDTWIADGVKVRTGSGAAHDVEVGSGYIRCHAVHGSIHQDGMQAGAGERLTFRNIAIDCLGNSNFYATGWGGGNADSVVCVGCALGPQSGSTLFTNSRSQRSGARNSLVCEGRHPQFTFRLESSTSVNENNQRAGRGDPRCAWEGLLKEVGVTPTSATPSGEAPAADDQAASGKVEVSLAGVTFDRTGRGRRVVAVELAANERASVQVRLVQKGKTFASKEITTTRTGSRTVRLVIAHSAAAGKASLRITVTDADGNTRTIKRTIRLPAP